MYARYIPAKTAPKRPTNAPPIFACAFTDAALEVMEGVGRV